MNQVIHGDSLDVLRQMDDNSIDAIVTDPPYGLSNGGTKGFSDRLGDVLFDVVLPDLYHANVAIGTMREFRGPFDSVAFLDFMLRSSREESGITVPESSVDFESYVVRKQEVENKRISSVGVAHSNLSLESNAQSREFVCDFILQPRPGLDATFGYGKTRLFTQSDSGRFSVPVVIPLDSGFARFLRTVVPSFPSFLADVVRLCHYATGGTSSSPGVVTGRRAEVAAMLTFHAGNGSVELLPATSTDARDTVFEIVTAKPIRASARAGSLSAKFEPRNFSLIGDSADGALTFHFHHSILSEMHYNRKGFMGKDWDGETPSEAIWRECLRVLKPGGHLLAFAGTRTQHRMAVRIEDAGFEIRDMIMWVYGSGFPKSLDVSKAIDRAAGAEREVVGPGINAEAKARHSAKHDPRGGVTYLSAPPAPMITAPATDAARQWEGWGTALKPALEPITVARKPLCGTVAANVLRWGTGALNIDACRVGDDEITSLPSRNVNNHHYAQDKWTKSQPIGEKKTYVGRWPANLVHDGSDEAADGLGHAARFFYCAKASRRERDAGLEDVRNHHATVKPIALMEWLIKLVTPPGGVVLDPFAGSGTTGCAAARLGMRSILIEREAEYVEIARRRVAYWAAELDAAAD